LLFFLVSLDFDGPSRQRNCSGRLSAYGFFLHQSYLHSRVSRCFTERSRFALHYCFFLPLRFVLFSTSDHVRQGLVFAPICLDLGWVDTAVRAWGAGRTKGHVWIWDSRFTAGLE